LQLDPNLFVASQRTAIAGSAWPTDAPHAFHLLAKPSGSTCNIDCSYCFFLSKEALYPDQRQHMSDGTLETYIRQLLESHQAPKVQVAWQGGEPTLMQLAFFQRAVELVERHRRPGQIVEHSIQTNGTLLDDDWCRFFKQHRFLVGLSVDGPRQLHDHYRVDRLGRGTFSRVLQGWRHLRQHGVEFNILCTVHAANQQHGRAVYRFLRDELDARWIQFIPIVERIDTRVMSTDDQDQHLPSTKTRPLYTQSGNLVTRRSVDPDPVRTVSGGCVRRMGPPRRGPSVRAAIRRGAGGLLRQTSTVCPRSRLRLWARARVQRRPLLLRPLCRAELPAGQHPPDPYAGAGGRRAAARVRATQAGIPVREMPAMRGAPWCHGGCPKDRFVPSPDGDADQNYLCPGYARFFSHAQPAMQCMVDLLQRGRPALGVMAWMAQRDAAGGPYQVCSCGSGRKLRFCHGERAPTSPFEGVADDQVQSGGRLMAAKATAPMARTPCRLDRTGTLRSRHRGWGDCDCVRRLTLRHGADSKRRMPSGIEKSSAWIR
jgi:uncharacterized protein